MNFSRNFFQSVIFAVFLSFPYPSCRSLQDAPFVMSDDNEYAAIKTIHKQLDDNADGSVDFKESEEFVKMELCGTKEKKKPMCMESEKSLKFHQMDPEITSTELWATWHENEVFSWVTEDVVAWLEHSVKLPRYTSNFVRQKITGRHLPYIAINAGQILQNKLGITDGQHKQKIQLRAMDIILFGPPNHYNGSFWKDVILVICMAWCLSGIVYAFRQRRLFRSRMDSFIADLRLKEDEVHRLKSRFDELDQVDGEIPEGERKEVNREVQDSPIMIFTGDGHGSPNSGDEYKTSTPLPDLDSVLSLAQALEKIEVLQDTVWSLEREIDGKDIVIQTLRQILPECQQKERLLLEYRKTLGEEQIAKAQRACEKIRKRRSSLFGTFHLANSSALEEAGLQITKAVNKMQYISECFEEHHKRWSKIGQMTGFPHSPRDFSMDQPSHTAFPIPPPRRYSVRIPDSGLSTFSIASRSLRQSTRYSRSSASSISNSSRSSEPFLVPNQLPSVEENDAEAVKTDGKDSVFSSGSSTFQSSLASPPGPRFSGGSQSMIRPHSSTGSRSSSSHHLLSEEQPRDGQEDSSSVCGNVGFRKFRSRERIKKRPVPEAVVQAKDSGSEDGTDSSTLSTVQLARGSVRSLNKISLSSEV